MRINNVFIALYFFFLAINNLNISQLQKDKSLLDVYYLLSGAIVFWIVIRIFDEQKVIRKISYSSKIDADTVAILLLISTILIKVLIFSQTGIRLLDRNWAGGGTGNLYSVGGLSGLAEIFIWLMLQLLPKLRRKSVKYLAVIVSVLFEAILSISRNNAMMIIVYLLVVFAMSKKDRLLIEKKTIKRIAVVSIIVAIVFTLFGNYRQLMRGWDNPNNSIRVLLQSQTNNAYINWLYGYTAINYDVMIQIMGGAEHPMTVYSVFSPIIRLVGGNDMLTSFHNNVYHIKALNGFNASTIFGPMIYEMGPWYIVQVLILGIQVGIFGLLARKEDSIGHYSYLIMFAALSVFGNLTEDK